MKILDFIVFFILYVVTVPIGLFLSFKFNVPRLRLCILVFMSILLFILDFMVKVIDDERKELEEKVEELEERIENLESANGLALILGKEEEE